MSAGGCRTAEDEEFEEADAILAELRRRAATGESDLPWGGEVERVWGADGALRLTRAYEATGPGGSVRLRLREFPYSAHPCSGVTGTGGVVWAGALALAELLQERRAELLGGRARVLEIGAGCGLSGLVAAALAGGDSEVLLTDESEAVLENLRHNAAANAEGLAARVEVARLAWEEVLDGAASPPMEAADLLLGSDVIWGDRGRLVGRLARRLVRPGGCLVITAQEGREGLGVFQEVIGRPCDPEAGDEGAGPPFDVVRSSAVVADESLLHFVCRRRAAD